jgi:TolB-like protein
MLVSGRFPPGAQAVSAQLRDRLQDVLGTGYSLERELAGGGMSRVFVAAETALGRRVVVKVLPWELAAGLSAERFRREKQVAAQLQHPLILPVLSAGEADGLLFYTMPYVEGESLQARLSREPAVPIADAVRILHDVLEALAHAHQHGVVHRDIKPGNILLAAHHAVVTDFGIAKALSVSASSGPLTATGIAVGTPAYMAPEQAAGDPAADHRADIYSFGVVAYELLTGCPPFGRPVGQAVLAADVAKQPKPGTNRRRALPPELAAIVMRCLEKDPAQRPQSADEILRELDAPSSRATRRPAGGWRGRTFVAGSAALIAIALTAYAVRGRGGKTDRSVDPILLAVLPFHPLAPSDSAGSLGIGIPDAIITRLAGIPGLRVRSTSAILRYESRRVDAQEAGRALRVHYVLTGTMEMAGDQFGARVQMVRVADGAPLWGKRFTLRRTDLLGLQDSVAARVTAALQIQMSSDVRERVYRRYTEDAQAYELYIRGRAEVARHTREATLAAVRLFEKAVARDSGYALAHAGLAVASAEMHLRFASGPEVAHWGELAVQAAQRASALDPSLAETHQALAAVYGRKDFDWEGTIAESRRALELNPSLEPPHDYLARAFYHLGLLDMAEAEVRVVDTSPTADQIEQWRIRGIIALLAGRFREAVASLERVRGLSSAPLADAHLAQAYYYTGDGARAEALLDELGQSASASAAARARAALASILAARGDRKAAQAMLRTVTGGGYIDHHVAYSIGAAYAQLGDHAAALRWLRRAASTGFPCYPWFARDPLLEPLRGDEQFRWFLAQLREAADAARARYQPAPRIATPG